MSTVFFKKKIKKIVDIACLNRYNCDVNFFLVMIKKAVLITVLLASVALINKALNVKNKVVDCNKQVALNSQKSNKQVIRLVFPNESRVVEIDITPLDEGMLISDAVIRATIRKVESERRAAEIAKMSFKDRIKLFYKKFKGE